MTLAASTSFSSLLSRGASAISVGWDSAYDNGTVADYYVNGVTGDDGNNGTSTGSAFATIQHAIDTATAPATIMVVGDGVKYREQVTMKSGITLLGYSTDKPILTAAEVLTGFTACVSGDEPIVGSNWASVYKATVSLSNVASGHEICLNLFEDDEQLTLAIGWDGDYLGDKFFQQSNADWYTADSVQVSGTPSLIQSYTSSAVTSAYSVAQIENCLLLGHSDPNVNFVSSITSVVGDVITIDDQTQEYETNEKRNTFTLVNLLPVIEEGGWGAVDNGDGTATVYVWPRDPANLTDKIEYSARPYGIILNGADNIVIRGLDVRQPAGKDSFTEGAGITNYSSSKQTNVTIEHCRVRGVFASGQSGYSGYGMVLRNIDNLTVNRNTIERVQGGYGVFVWGGSLDIAGGNTDFSDHVDFQRNSVTLVEQGPFRFYTTNDAVVAHNYAERCALGAHANKMNFYEQCHSILAWGNRWKECSGYITHQETSGIFWMFNLADADSGSASSLTSRAFVDQNNATTPPNATNGDTVVSIIANNSFLPKPISVGEGSTSQNGMTVTSDLASNSTVSFKVLNNLTHGILVEDVSLVDEASDNWDTSGNGGINSNDVSASVAAVYRDLPNGDHTIKSDSAIRSASGTSLVDSIENVLKPRFDDRFDGWTLDAMGKTFDPSNPPIGAVADFRYPLI